MSTGLLVTNFMIEYLFDQLRHPWPRSLAASGHGGRPVYDGPSSHDDHLQCDLVLVAQRSPPLGGLLLVLLVSFEFLFNRLRRLWPRSLTVFLHDGRPFLGLLSRNGRLQCDLVVAQRSSRRGRRFYNEGL